MERGSMNFELAKELKEAGYARVEIEIKEQK